MYIQKGRFPFVFRDLDDEQFIEELYDFCLEKEAEILQLPRTWEIDSTSPTSARYGSYNFLTFPSPIVKRVFDSIKEAYIELAENQKTPNESLWIQSWMNIHRKNEFLNIHRHLGFRAHGYLSVNTNGTSTIYEIDDEEDFEVKNRNGLLTLVGTDDIWHRVTPYTGDRVRISIAFDIIRSSDVSKSEERIVIPFY